MTSNPNQLRLETCAFCGEHFYSKRSDKKTCSGKCRQRLFRWRSRLNTHQASAVKIIDEIAAYCAYPEARPGAAQVLRQIREYVALAEKANGIARVK